MAFILLKNDNEQDYYCSTSNVAGIQAWDKEVRLTVQHGPRLFGRPNEVKLQDAFRISAANKAADGAALELAQDISAAEKAGTVLDLRDRCILTKQGPAMR